MKLHRPLLFLKITLTALFLLCLLCMSHNYYHMVRLAGFFGFFLLAYNDCLRGRLIQASLCVCLALLFQPIVKVFWGRAIWSVIDVVSAVGLIVSIIVSYRTAPGRKG